MALYVDSDMAADFNGDLKIDTKGDIGLADALETHKTAANFILRTDFGQYAANNLVGANLGAFIGSTNTADNHRKMENNIYKALRRNVYNAEDVRADVVHFDFESSLCIITLAGAYVIDNQILQVNAEPITYAFPYAEGNPSPLTI